MADWKEGYVQTSSLGVQDKDIQKYLEALTPYNADEYVYSDLECLSTKVKAHRQFKKEMHNQGKSFNIFKKSDCEYESRIQEVLQEYRENNECAVFISEAFPLDLNLPLKVFPPCKLVQVLFLCENKPSFLMSIYSEKTMDVQVRSYTHMVATVLKETLFNLCQVSFALVSCHMLISDFNIDSLRKTVNERFKLATLFERDNPNLQPDTLQHVRTAAIVSASLVPTPVNSSEKGTFLAVEQPWRDVLSLIIEKGCKGQLDNITVSPTVDHFKLKSTRLAVLHRQQYLPETDETENNTKMVLKIKDPLGEKSLEFVFKEGEYNSDESEFECSSYDSYDSNAEYHDSLSGDCSETDRECFSEVSENKCISTSAKDTSDKQDEMEDDSEIQNRECFSEVSENKCISPSAKDTTDKHDEMEDDSKIESETGKASTRQQLEGRKLIKQTWLFLMRRNDPKRSLTEKIVQNVTCFCLDRMDTDEDLELWRKACSSPQQDVIDSKVYRNLFDKFVILSVNVDAYLTTQPSPQLKHPHDVVNAVGDIHGTEVFQAGGKQLSLIPSQERLLDLDLVDDDRDDVKLLWGPPGTGKTVLLELRALQWVKHFGAQQIVILQTRQDGTAASCLVEYQLQQTLNAQQQRAQQSGTDTQSAQCTFIHVDLSGLSRLETSSKGGEKEVLKEEWRNILRQKFFHYKQWTSSDAINIVADDANGNITAAVYQWLKNVGVAIVRLWSAVELFVDPENIPVSLQRVVCHVTEPLRCPGPVVQQVMGARQIVEGDVPGYDVGWLPTSVPQVILLLHDHTGRDGHSKGDRPWRCEMCSMNIVITIKGLLVGEGDEGRPGLSANDVFILSSRMSCDKPDDDVLSPAPLIKTLTDNGYGVRTLSAASSRDEIMSVIRADAKSPAITVANERCVLGLEKKVVLYCDTAAKANLSGKLLAFSRTTSLLIFISSDECITDSKLPRTRDHLDINHLDKMTDRLCMPTWKTREEKDEMDWWTPLHVACYNNRLDKVRSLVKPRCPDLSRPGDVISEKPAATAKVESPKQGAFAEAAGISSTDPGAPVTDSKDVTEGSPAHSSVRPVTVQEDSSPTQRVDRNIPIQYGYWQYDIDVETEVGETPLFVASSRGHAEIVKYLLQRGADAKIRNQDGKSPKDIAAQQGHTAVVDLLSSHE